jgi:hypothetical protein
LGDELVNSFIIKSIQDAIAENWAKDKKKTPKKDDDESDEEKSTLENIQNWPKFSNQPGVLWIPDAISLLLTKAPEKLLKSEILNSVWELCILAQISFKKRFEVSFKYLICLHLIIKKVANMSTDQESYDICINFIANPWLKNYICRPFSNTYIDPALSILCDFYDFQGDDKSKDRSMEEFLKKIEEFFKSMSPECSSKWILLIEIWSLTITIINNLKAVPKRQYENASLADWIVEYQKDFILALNKVKKILSITPVPKFATYLAYLRSPSFDLTGTGHKNIKSLPQGYVYPSTSKFSFDECHKLLLKVK